MNSIIAGRFIPIDLVATSSTDDLWRAWDIKREDLCGIKVLPVDESADAVGFILDKREIFEHPHLVTPYGWGGQGISIVLALPLVSGGTLTELIAEHGPMGEAAALRTTRQLLEGLAQVHAAGWVHRRISSGTVMYRDDLPPMHTVLSGFSAAIPETDAARVPTRNSDIMKGFLAPGVLRGLPETTMSDVYSVGVVALTAVAGLSVPRDETYTPHELQGLLGHISAPFAAVIERMLEPNPENRYRSAVEALDALPEPSGEPLTWQSGEELRIVDRLSDIPEDFDPHAPTDEGEIIESPNLLESVPLPSGEDTPASAEPEESELGDDEPGRYENLSRAGWAAAIAGLAIAIATGAVASYSLVTALLQ